MPNYKKWLDTTSVKQRINLRELAGTYTTLHEESITELAGPCPKCGGDKRFHVTATSFMCRHCHEKWGDAIEFVRWIDGIGFREAINKLGGDAGILPTSNELRPIDNLQPAQRLDWIKRASYSAGEANRCLSSPAGQAGADYLLSRGIGLTAWEAFKLGYRADAPLPNTWDNNAKRFVYPPQPAIVIPWYDETGQVQAIRYRFLWQHQYCDANGRPRREKLTASKGSQFAGMFFGLSALLGVSERLMTLLICEGEFNALSSWQMQHHAKLDVLCLGSESQRLTPEMVARAQQYKRVIVWADRNDIACQWQQQIPGACAKKSPNGHDANDLLRAGKLGGHLAGIRYQAAMTDEEREGLLWDLYDSAMQAPGVDADTVDAILYMAKQLGKSGAPVALRMAALSDN